MNITVEVIPHDKQRYKTCGDWFYEPNGEDLVIRVSKLSDWRYEALVAVHELVEVLMCKHIGITQEQVDQFDMEFEKQREAGLADPGVGAEEKTLLKIAEPGDQYRAPYRTEHCVATGVERILAAGLGVVWSQYETEIEALP